MPNLQAIREQLMVSIQSITMLDTLFHLVYLGLHKFYILQAASNFMGKYWKFVPLKDWTEARSMFIPPRFQVEFESKRDFLLTIKQKLN